MKSKLLLGLFALVLAVLTTLPAPGATPKQGVELVVSGYAVVRATPEQAKDAAITDALATAICQAYGEEIAKRKMSGAALMKLNVAARAEKTGFVTYKVLEDLALSGLYRVKLSVRFTQDLPKDATNPNTSLTIGGKEVVAGGDPANATVRQTIADSLGDSFTQVIVDDKDTANGKELAQRAQENKSDLALYVDATARPKDRFGEFYSFGTRIEYEWMMVSAGTTITGGFVEGINKERSLNAGEAASRSLRDTGRTAAGEVLQRLTDRFDKTHAYAIYLLGATGPRQVDEIASKLGTIPGVQNVRLLDSGKGIYEIAMTIDPAAREAIVTALKQAGLGVIRSDAYTAVAELK